MRQKIALTLKKTIDLLMHGGQFPTVRLPEIVITRPKDDQFGEYTTNVALMLGKLMDASPREIALGIQQGFILQGIDRVEIAGPGHLNFFLTQEALTNTVEEIFEEKERYGNSMQGDGERVNNEFISANPTGPLHLGNARGGFFGDTLGAVLRKAGYTVTNEYYVNDAGEQVIKLGHSVLKDDEAVYGGAYIDDLNEKIKKIKTEWEVRDAGQWAAKTILEEMLQPATKDVMRIYFDVWQSEQLLFDEGYVDKALALLSAKQLTYEKDGALWLKTTEYGDDKDRVLVKQDGVKTYLASDCGYLLHKIERGFTTLIEIWGADHHGYTGRIQAAATALGFTGKIHFRMVQLVKLMKDGEEVRMSKRAGNVVSIDELIERVGHDVARFFFLMYSPDTHMNFDLGLAEERSEKNPVFYVQYAHARLASILRKAEERAIRPAVTHLHLLTHPKERLLLRELIAFPELVANMAEDLVVHPLPQYAIRLSDRLHSFYADCQVIDEKNEDLSGARLALIGATKTVLAETLRLLGIAAPEKM